MKDGAVFGSGTRGRAAAATCIGAAAAVTAVALSGCASGEPIAQPFASVSTTTTRMASADIVGLDRERSAVCAPPVTGGDAPATVAVVDPDLLDGICALGLQQRVVAVAGDVPEYLRAGFGAVRRLQPDVTAAVKVGTQKSAASTGADGASVVPSPVGDWRRSLRALGDVLRSPAQARSVIDRYDRDAADRSARIDGVHTVVSLVRFTADRAALAEGTSSPAAQVLTDLEIRRPTEQRGASAVQMRDENFGAAEADLVYVGYQGEAGRDFGVSQMSTSQWKALRAVYAKRQFLVQDSAWFGGGGPIAARAVLTDVVDSVHSTS